MEKKICVYTCITGNYDEVNEIQYKEKNIDYYLFTNNIHLKSKSFKVIYIKNNGLDNITLARKIKILSHRLLSKYDITVWIDGAIFLKQNISNFLNDKCDLDKYSLVGFSHHSRDCIYDEIDACAKYYKEDLDLLINQKQYLMKKNYPKNNGLIESTVLVRKNNDETVKKTMKMWYNFILKKTKRDQLSFNYCVGITGLKFQLIDMYVFDNEFFGWKLHDKSINIIKYRYYCGDINNFKVEKCCDSYYTSQIDNIKILNNCKKICLFPTVDTWIEIKKLVIDKKYNVEYKNFFEFDRKKIVYNESQIIVYGNFKKGDILNIHCEVNKINYYDLLCRINDLLYSNNELMIKNEKTKMQLDAIKSGKFWKFYCFFKNKFR